MTIPASKHCHQTARGARGGIDAACQCACDGCSRACRNGLEARLKRLEDSDADLKNQFARNIKDGER